MKLLLPLLLGLAASCQALSTDTSTSTPAPMRVHFLELVTPDVDATIAAYTDANGLTFGEPVPELGNARTAPLPDGGMVSVRAPMHDQEQPATRPYWLVEDIEARLAEAVAAGGVVAHPPFELPGHGTFAIYFLGDLEHGLWQL